MARTYRRDARGRFAGGGFSGQSGGRGARLKGGGAKRSGGGAIAKGTKRVSPSGAIRATDVVKAKMDNARSKMVEKNQDRYDRYAISVGKFPRAENATRRRIAAQNRIARQKR